MYEGSEGLGTDDEAARRRDLREAANLAGALAPLPEMSPVERVVADYEGTGLTIGPHPMALRREEMRMRGALRASDLPPSATAAASAWRAR